MKIKEEPEEDRMFLERFHLLFILMISMLCMSLKCFHLISMFSCRDLRSRSLRNLSVCFLLSLCAFVWCAACLQEIQEITDEMEEDHE